MVCSDFKRKNVLQRTFMSVSDLEKYYCNLRKVNFYSHCKLSFIHERKPLQPLLKAILSLDRISKHQQIEILGNVPLCNTPTIYACTHVGGDDIARLFEILKVHCYLFLGDPKGLYKDFSGLLLFLNGCICTETSDKEDRHIAYLRSVELLKAGGSLMIFPEGAWNITDNLPVMKLFPGTSKMSIENNSPILPVAIEQYDNRFVVNFGTYIVPSNFSEASLSAYLRDCLATLKWEIWEREGRVSRKTFYKTHSDSFAQEIVNRCPYDFSIEDVERTRFHLKFPNQAEVFKFLDEIEFTPKNAFLLHR